MSERPTPIMKCLRCQKRKAASLHYLCHTCHAEQNGEPENPGEKILRLERELAEARESLEFQIKLNREVIEKEKKTHAENLEQARLLGMSGEREASLMAQIEHHKQAAELNKQEIEKAIPEPPSPQWIAINLLARQRDQLAKACRDARLCLTGEALPTKHQAIKAIDDALAILDAP